MIAIASNLPNAHFHKQTRSSDLFGNLQTFPPSIEHNFKSPLSYITIEIVKFGLAPAILSMWESALANIPAVFFSYFSLWLCYEAQLTPE